MLDTLQDMANQVQSFSDSMGKLMVYGPSDLPQRVFVQSQLVVLSQPGEWFMCLG